MTRRIANKNRKIISGPAAEALIPVLRKGGVGVFPTDTIYGIVGSALNKKTVERIYRLRKRDPQKPMIVLVGDMAQVKKFGIAVDGGVQRLLRGVWPGQVSAILPIARKAQMTKYKYLHRGTKTLAFRLPKPAWLRALLKKTGPLIAPSANFEGKKPARTVHDAKKYFGDAVDFYADVGPLASKPSTLIKIDNKKLIILRQGAGMV